MNDQDHNMSGKPGETSSVRYRLLKQSRVPVWVMAIVIVALLAAAVAAVKLIHH